MPRPAALRQRTDGNPFFLVEYARLAREGGDLSGLLAEAHPPAAVHDVLARRLKRLPEETVSALRWAALVGRQFDLGTLAAVSRVEEDDLLDHLDPALDAGLVREDGIDRYLFGHALVRDTIYAAIPAARRARAHARVAEALCGHARAGERGGAALARRRPVPRRPGLAGGGRGGRRWPVGCTPTRSPRTCSARRSTTLPAGPRLHRSASATTC